jgi:hypothetical protein
MPNNPAQNIFSFDRAKLSTINTVRMGPRHESFTRIWIDVANPLNHYTISGVPKDDNISRLDRTQRAMQPGNQHEVPFLIGRQ